MNDLTQSLRDLKQRLYICLPRIEESLGIDLGHVGFIPDINLPAVQERWLLQNWPKNSHNARMLFY